MVVARVGLLLRKEHGFRECFVEFFSGSMHAWSESCGETQSHKIFQSLEVVLVSKLFRENLDIRVDALWVGALQQSSSRWGNSGKSPAEE